MQTVATKNELGWNRTVAAGCQLAGSGKAQKQVASFSIKRLENFCGSTAPEGRKHVAWGVSPMNRNRVLNVAPEGRKQSWSRFRPSGAGISRTHLLPGLASGATCFRPSGAEIHDGRINTNESAVSLSAPREPASSQLAGYDAHPDGLEIEH